MQRAKHKVTHPFVFAPLLVLILVFFITVSRFIPMNKLGIIGACLLMCFFQAVMFGIPIGIYAYMRRGALRTAFAFGRTRDNFRRTHAYSAELCAEIRYLPLRL